MQENPESLRTVGYGEAHADLPFTISVCTRSEHARIDVLADSIPESGILPLLQFAALYSPSGVVEMQIAGQRGRMVYQTVRAIDLEAVCAALCKLEPGWQLWEAGKLLVPPNETRLEFSQVREVLKASSVDAMVAKT